MEEFTTNSIECCQGEGEADELRVEKAVNDDSTLTKIIGAKDVDILIIFTV